MNCGVPLLDRDVSVVERVHCYNGHSDETDNQPDDYRGENLFCGW